MSWTRRGFLRGGVDSGAELVVHLAEAEDLYAAHCA